MEVCGGQTHSLLRHGIDAELEGVVELIHGPGCPVCVTPLEAIDFAQELEPAARHDARQFRRHAARAGQPRQPAGRTRRWRQRAGGLLAAGCRRVGSAPPANGKSCSLRSASRRPRPPRHWPFDRPPRRGLDNFSLLVAHVRVLARHGGDRRSRPTVACKAFSPPDTSARSPAARNTCRSSSDIRMPVVVTGFEPVDLLQGILECVRLLESGRAEVANCYRRTAQRRAIRRPETGGRRVRGLRSSPGAASGSFRSGGLRLRAEWQRFDAEARFGTAGLPILEPPECRSGDVLAGRIKPTACASFGTACTPDHPLGAPMVSSEGACAAYYRYAAAARNILLRITRP